MLRVIGAAALAAAARSRRSGVSFVTNAHVVDSAKKLSVTLASGTYPGMLVGSGAPGKESQMLSLTNPDLLEEP